MDMQNAIEFLVYTVTILVIIAISSYDSRMISTMEPYISLYLESLGSSPG